MRVVAVLLLCAGPAVAADFVAPSGCETWLTVQQRSCRVSNHFRCAADAPGDQWRTVYNDEGPTIVARIDRETQWVESISVRTGVTDLLDPGAPDPASFSDLLRTGRDDFDFSTTGSDGLQRRYKGYDRLTGRTLVIDGITLQETEFAMEESGPDGTVQSREHGHQVVHEGWRRFFGGKSVSEGDQGTESFDHSPVAFIFPGEPGFAATVPLFDCDAVISGLPPGVIHARD